MKLEEATKEELIYWIELHEWKLASELKGFEKDILFYRIQKNSKEHKELFARYSETLSAYIEFLKPYDNISIIDIPKDVLNKGVKLERELKDLNKKLQKKEKEWSKYNKKIDEILQI